MNLVLSCWQALSGYKIQWKQLYCKTVFISSYLYIPSTPDITLALLKVFVLFLQQLVSPHTFTFLILVFFYVPVKCKPT